MHEDDWLEAAYEERFECDDDLRDLDEEAYNESLMEGEDL